MVTLFCRWVHENVGKGNLPVQTIRDFITATTTFATASLTFVSIFVALSKTGVFAACVKDFSSCGAGDRLAYLK